MSLKAELDAFRSEFMVTVAPETRDAMVRADMETGCFRHSAKRVEGRRWRAGFPVARRWRRLRTFAGAAYVRSSCPQFLPRRLAPILKP
jgi:hypothetical protein